MNIHLIVANSYRIIDREIKKIVKESNFFRINFNKSTISDILDEASYFSFDSTSKIIVVSNADFFGTGKLDEKDSERLVKYLENPNPNTIIIFTTMEGIDSRKKITKIIKERYHLINIPAWDKKALRNEALNYLQEKDFNIDYNTLTYILDNTYNNVDILYNELDKLMMYYNSPCNITLKDVENIIGREVDSNNFHFVSAVIEKDLENSIRIMNNLKIYKVESVTLINLLAREYRLMYYVKKMREDKNNMDDICKNLAMQEWQVNKLYNNSLNYTDNELLKNLSELAKIDLKIKSGILDKDIALYPFLLEACI